MERITFQNSRGITLVGNFYQANSTSVVIMAHGFSSDKYSKGRFPKLAHVLTQSNFNVLTFDFSGCGESEDDSLTVQKEVDDLQSAIRFVKEKGFQRISLYGHSLGSLICLKCYSEEIVTIVLSGALTGAMYYDWKNYYTEKQLEELETTGQLTEYRNEGIRKKVVIDKQMLLDFEQINPEELLKLIKCPVLIIHGNNDEEEIILYERSQKAMSYLSNSQLVVIDEATHSFLEHYDILIDLVTKWFRDH